MPAYVAGTGNGNGERHMILGRGPKGYLLTLMYHGERGPRALLIVEVWADGMIPAIAMVEEISDGEVVSCVKLWA
jgi:hypothetical protein